MSLSSALTSPQGATIETLTEQLESTLLGKQQQVRLAICCLIAGGHLLVEDRPGVGKTTLAHALGQSLGMSWTRVQFTNDLLPADITGISVFDQRKSDFTFKPGPVFTPILMADEINRAPPRAQSALLEAMEERQVTVDGKTHKLDEQFFVIATQNPADRAGAYPLPESQLDRFLVGIELGYPDTEVEKSLLMRPRKHRQNNSLDAVCNGEDLERWQTEVDSIHVSQAIADYAHDLLQASRQREEQQKDCRALSPRAGINLISMARAHAYVQKRSMVIPDDIQAIFSPVAAHRLKGTVAVGTIVARELLAQVALN